MPRPSSRIDSESLSNRYQFPIPRCLRVDPALVPTHALFSCHDAGRTRSIPFSFPAWLTSACFLLGSLIYVGLPSKLAEWEIGGIGGIPRSHQIVAISSSCMHAPSGVFFCLPHQPSFLKGSFRLVESFFLLRHRIDQRRVAYLRATGRNTP